MIHFKRFLVILLSFSVSWVLQMIVFPRVPYLITSPNLLLVEVISCGFLFGRMTGLLVGVAAGLLLDILGIGIPGYYTLILSVLGFLDGLFSEKIDSELVIVLFLLFVFNELLFHAYSWGLSFLFGSGRPLGIYLKELFLPELMLSLVCFLAVYGVLLLTCNRWDLKVNKGEIKIV